MKTAWLKALLTLSNAFYFAVSLPPVAAIDWEPTKEEVFASSEFKELTRKVESAKYKPPELTTRGKYLAAKWQEELALKDFADALAIDPRFLRAYAARARVYLVQNKPELALKDFEKVAKQAEATKHADDIAVARGALNQAGQTYMRLQDYDKGIATINRAQKLAPLQTEDLVVRAQCYARKHDYKNAFADLKKAEAVGAHVTSVTDIAMLRGDLHVEQKAWNDAIADYTAAINHLDASSQTRDVLIATKDKHKRVPLALKKRAQCYKEIHRDDLAQKDLRRVAELNETTLDFIPFRASDADFSAPKKK